MKKQKMDLWMTGSLDGYASPIPVGGWKGLHKMRKKKDRKAFYWFLAASILLIGALGIWNLESVKHFTAEQSDRPGPTQAKNTQKLFSGPNIKGSDDQVKAHRTPFPGEKEAQERQAPSKDLVDEDLPPGKENERVNDKHSELQDIPVHAVSGIVAPKIANRKVAIFVFPTSNEKRALTIRNAFIPRRMKRMTFFVEASAYMGYLSFSNEASLATYRPEYNSYIKTYKLRYFERSFGFGAYYHGLRRWSIGSGLSVSQNTVSGDVNYAYFESGLQLVDLGAQTWSRSAIDQSENLDHRTLLRSWNIQMPFRFRYQLFADYGPVLEIGAIYAYNLKNQGDWVNPETLTVERSTALVPKHRVSAEIGLGYQWDLNKTCILVNYRFSPWSTKYAPIQGRLGAPLHGIGIQLQMPR